MAPDGARIFAINDYDNSISVVSTATNTVVDTWPTALVGANPRAVAVSPDNQRLYVVGNSQVFVAIDIASRSRIATVTLNLGGAFGVVASPDGSRVYVMATASDAVAILDTAPYALSRRCRCGGYYVRSDAMSLSPDGRFAYVPEREDVGANEIPICSATDASTGLGPRHHDQHDGRDGHLRRRDPGTSRCRPTARPCTPPTTTSQGRWTG